MSDVFGAAFESTIAATKLDHRDASASVYKFLGQERFDSVLNDIQYLKSVQCYTGYTRLHLYGS